MGIGELTHIPNIVRLAPGKKILLSFLNGSFTLHGHQLKLLSFGNLFPSGHILDVKDDLVRKRRGQGLGVFA